MLHMVAWYPAVPRVFNLRIRTSLCVVSSYDTLLQACAARPRDIVVVPTGLLDGLRAVRIRGLIGPECLLFAVARELDDATSAIDSGLYDEVVSALGLESELVDKLGCRRTLEWEAVA